MFLGRPLYPFSFRTPENQYPSALQVHGVEEIHEDTVDDTDSADAWTTPHDFLNDTSTFLKLDDSLESYATTYGLTHLAVEGASLWDVSTAYDEDDVVLFSNGVYKCVNVAGSTGDNPKTDGGTNWAEVVAMEFWGYDPTDPWDNSTTYDEGDVVHRYQTVFVSAQGSNLDNDPYTDTDGTYWVASGSVDVFKPFNQTLTDRFLDTTTPGWKWTLEPGDNYIEGANLEYIEFATLVDAVGLFNLYAGKIRLRLSSKDEGEIIYDETVSMVDDGNMDDWHDYFFGDVRLFKEHIFANLPQYELSDVVYEVWVVAPGTSTGIAVGSIQLVSSSQLGGTVYGTSLTYKDYSVKTTDQFGNTDFTVRPVSLIVDYDFVIPTDAIRYARTLITDNRANNAVFYAVDDDQVTGTLVFGRIARELEINISGPNKSRATLSVESLAT